MQKDTAAMGIVKAEELGRFVREILKQAGFPKDVAATSAETLLKADMRGIDSHGVARLSGYLRLVKSGRINTDSNPKIIHESPSTATLDADGGLGLWTAGEAMKIAIRKAETAGSGWVAVQNSSHFGIAAAHAEMALKHDMIGLAMTNASPLVAPAGSRKAYLGTNPICVAIPAGKRPAFIADLATAAAANGKLEIAQRKGNRIPFGWGLDAEGNPSEDPDLLKSGGVLLPLGSDADHGFHKGYALGAWVDIFSGVLSGANFGAWVPPFVSFLEPIAPVGKGIGHFLGAWRIDAFQPAEEFKSRMDAWINGVKALERAEGVDEILVPGEPEHRTEQFRKRAGIPLSPKVWADMESIAGEYGVRLPT